MKWRKLLARILTLGILAGVLPASAATADTSATPAQISVTISVDGKEVISKSADSRAIDGTIYLPADALAGVLGFAVNWNDDTRTVTITTQGSQTAYTVGQENVTSGISLNVDGKQVIPTNSKGKAVNLFILDGVIYLPVRAVAEALGCEVDWDGSANAVQITSKENIVLKAGAGIAEMILPQEYFINTADDGTITYEDGFSGEVHTFWGAEGAITDNLCTRVLLIQDEVRIAIVALEVAQAPDDQVAYTKQIVSEICDVDENNVWVHTTHQFGFMHRPSDPEKAAVYDAVMKQAAAEAARQAIATFQPAVLGVGEGECYVSANKNITRPDGVQDGPFYGPGSTLETDPTMTILRFESAETGDPIGFFMSYGTKPSALCTTGKTEGNRQVNTEVTGQACKWMEEEYGVPCMFCMPAAGDQYPRETAQYYGFDENGEWTLIDIGFDEGIKIVDRLGAEMGQDAIEIAKTIRCTVDKARVDIAATSFQYLNKAEDGEIEVSVDAIALGNIAFVGFKQEMDCLTGQQIQAASPYETTLMVSFLNGDGKYLGHKEAYDFNGGIGTWETKRSAFAVGAAEEFVTVAAQLLDDLQSGLAGYDPGAGVQDSGSQTVSNGTVEFGGLTWYVLDKVDGKTLVMSEKVLEMRPYHNDLDAFTWETCDLRAYLNSEFLNRFTAEEQAKIVEVTNQNKSNSVYGITGGNATTDRVFLLSLEEAELYLQGFASMLVGETESGEAAWWYLRSPGEAVNVAACVNTGGVIDYHGVSDTLTPPVGGVRPVMWLDLG